MTAINTLDPRAAGGRRFAGKIAIVAGSGQGIGRAAARRLAQEGATVVAADIVESTAQRVADELRAFGASASPYVGDLSQVENCQALMARAKDEYGRIDVLVNIVGGNIWWRLFEHYEPDQIVKEVNKNFWPTMWLCWSVLPYMIEQQSGAIVNIATHAVVSQYRLPYAASKAGIMGLTTSLSKEVAKHGIRVNCVVPHGTEADDRVVPGHYGVDVESNPIPPEQEEARRKFQREIPDKEIPMGRRARAEEQASAIAFLASDDASYISGQVLPVGGGATFPF
jgi:dihydroxycyclohexadiene carboxylate dehydrogenase